MAPLSHGEPKRAGQLVGLQGSGRGGQGGAPTPRLHANLCPRPSILRLATTAHPHPKCPEALRLHPARGPAAMASPWRAPQSGWCPSLAPGQGLRTTQQAPAPLPAPSPEGSALGPSPRTLGCRAPHPCPGPWGPLLLRSVVRLRGSAGRLREARFGTLTKAHVTSSQGPCVGNLRRGLLAAGTPPHGSRGHVPATPAAWGGSLGATALPGSLLGDNFGVTAGFPKDGLLSSCCPPRPTASSTPSCLGSCVA